jgi:4,5-DOPA dioxygenase extradiol
MEQLPDLPHTPRLPVLFVGHGSPLNVIEANRYRAAWQDWGRAFGAGARWPRPALILCISAHWLTDGWWLTGMAQPRTIHDFGGFPRALYEIQYPAPGAPALARALAQALRQPGSGAPLGVDEGQWGLDHGCWGVLQPMFPQADIPVVQLSMDAGQAPALHFELGRQLRPLRSRGVLIVASGNAVHNLRAMRRELPDDQAYDWAIAFDAALAERIEAGRLQELASFADWGGQAARLAHPSVEHLLPLLYAAGAAYEGEPATFFNVGFQAGSVSMRSVVWAETAVAAGGG